MAGTVLALVMVVVGVRTAITAAARGSAPRGVGRIAGVASVGPLLVFGLSVQPAATRA